MHNQSTQDRKNTPIELEKYFAQVSDTPLTKAFEKKISLHPALPGKLVQKEEYESTIEALLQKPRKGRSVAYVHVPFCRTHCLYCGFYNKPYRKQDSHTYATVVEKEFALWADKPAVMDAPIHALYFGGGTPTDLEPEDALRVLKAARKYLPLANDCEITMEGRLYNINEASVAAYMEGGVNRFSMGVQTFHTDIRQSLKRIGSREQLVKQLALLQETNQAAVIVDLIYGLPGQDMQRWREDLAFMQSLKLDGCDCYQLNVYDQTPLGKAVAEGSIVTPPDVSTRAHMYAEAVDMLDQGMYRRLSLSHWGRTTRERNIYNLYVKSDAHCLSFGPGAGGNIDGLFYMNTSDWDTWIQSVEAGRKPFGFMQHPTIHYRDFRAIAEGFEQGFIDIASLEQSFGQKLAHSCRPLLEQWQEAGLLHFVHGRARLTIAGEFWQTNLSQLLLNFLKRHLEASSHEDQ